MSKEEDKIKHSKRLHADETHIKKQVKIAKSFGVEVKEPHKLAKHHALDCGVPNCPLCSSPRKLFKEETKQEKSHKQPRLYEDWDGCRVCGVKGVTSYACPRTDCPSAISC